MKRSASQINFRQNWEEEKEGKIVASLNGQTAVTLGSPVKRAVINVQIMNHPCIFVKARP